MNRKFTFGVVLTALAIGLLLPGCFRSSSNPGASSGDSSKSDTANANAGDEKSTKSRGEQLAEGGTVGGGWEDYPDVPYVAITEEIGAIEIPRVKTDAETLELTGEVPVDAGNEAAQQYAGEPVTGDWLTIRISTEPESLNPITETSAAQTYIMGYVNESLLRLNPETLEREPNLAEKWVAEDSIKLSPNYPGRERRVALGDGKAAAQLRVNFPAVSGRDEQPVLTLTTMDLDRQPIGDTWVGLFPADESMAGAPQTGYHYWSDRSGKLEVSGIVPGPYTVRVGVEIFGKATQNADGSLTVTPESPKNPLAKELETEERQSLKLDKGDWIDLQEQTVYTYQLRKDAKWSDGVPFTTKDLEFAYAILNNPFVDGESLRVYYQDLVACEALDPHTVRMKYRKQYFLSQEFTADLAATAPPWHLFEKFFEDDGETLTLERLTEQEEQAQNKVSVHGQQFGKFFNTDNRYNRAPLGTGPYIVDKWVDSDRVELIRNRNYWNPDRAGYLDRLIFKFIPDNVTALRALQAGEIDFLYRMDSEQYFEDLAGPPEWFKDKYVKASWFSPGFGYVGWNMLKPMFQDRRVRTALALLFNVEEFVEKKLHGEALMVSGSQYYFGPGYDHQVQPLGFAPDVARDLLADAGWVDTNNDGILDKDGRRFEFDFLMPPGSTVAEDRAALMQRSLKDAGIVMNIKRLEWASFLERVKSRKFDAVNLGWASTIESDPYQIWHGSEAGADKRGSNHVSFSNPLADQLIDQLRLTLDKEKRKRIHWSIHRILDQEQPYLFLYTPKDYGGYHKRFHGVKWYRVRPGFDLTEWYVPKDQQIH